MSESHKIDVLILAFNRPKLVQKLLYELPPKKVSKIYISIDGPRNREDVVAAEEMLSLVGAQINGIPVIVRHVKQNLGCRLGVLSGLEWFFDEVSDGGLVLEDDCSPLPGLFDFIGNRLHELNDPKIGMICAHNPYGEVEIENYLSRFIFINGWYMKSQTWKSLRQNIFELRLPSRFKHTNHPRKMREAIYWWATYARARVGVHDTWDSLFYRTYSEFGLSSLVSPRNLIENLGFGENATHTRDPNGSILIKNGPSLATAKFSSRELDDILADRYFKIRNRHMFTPFYKVFRDILMIRNIPDFDEQLARSEAFTYGIDT